MGGLEVVDGDSINFETFKKLYGVAPVGSIVKDYKLIMKLKAVQAS